jgi:hypothetical protein
MPELSKDIYNCLYADMIWEDEKLIVSPIFELEEDVKEFHDIVDNCLKGIPYKIEVNN